MAVAGALAAQAPADVVFRGGRIYTANDRAPTAEAVAIRGDRIEFVGRADAVARYIGPKTRVIELGQRVLLPGLADAHAHLAGIGERERTLNLEGTRSVVDLVARVEGRVRLARPGEWVTGVNWIETGWPERRFPTRQDLDRVSPNTPVFLGRSDGHASVANSAALAAAGVTATTTAPFGGEILRDDQGQPTGMLIDNAQDLVASRIPASPPEALDSAFVVGARREVRLGWTQLHDAGGPWSDVERLRRLYREGHIKLRVYKAVAGPGPAADLLLRRGASVGEFGGRLTVRAIKAYLDGALGSRGAALLEPYADRPDARGLLVTPLTQLRPMLERALRRGIQVEVHAIGDSANRLLLDLVADAFRRVPPGQRAIPAPRWRDEHTQVVAPADVPRFAKLGVIPSMQPSHAISDLHFAPSRLGPDRIAGAYAWRSLLQTGVPIAGGSDAPVERGEPMIEFYAAVARRDTLGFQGADWHPEQVATREEALKMFTVWPAYAAFEEDRRGTIEAGKWADFTVISGDIMQMPAPEILKARAVMTVIAGEIVWEE
jgi:predicted amidohydrolase YtcJ